MLKEQVSKNGGPENHKTDYENALIIKSLKCAQLNAIHEVFLCGESLI